MNNPLHFFTELLKRPIYEVMWVFFMMVIHLAAIAFWDEYLAKAIVVIFMISSMLMMGLYSAYGFTRIMGFGHVLWIPLAVWIATSIPGAEGWFATYLMALLITIVISLAIDITDVIRYLKG
ncbi:MAG: hypothetical protein ACNA78_10450, partial [Balneolaceae bacterium]